MKKIIFSFIFSLFLLIFNSKVLGFEFIKDSNNPLNVNYINDYSQQLQSHIFKKDNQYQGIFTIKKLTDSFYSLGFFKSNDGINWQMEKLILRDSVELSNARYFKTETGTIKIFLTRYDADSKYRIYSTDCDDSFNCSQILTLILNIDANDSTEQNGLFAGFPYQQGNRTYLFYGAWGIDGFKIRLAYSDDLRSWIKCSNKANLVFGGDGPFVYQKDNLLYLFTHQSNSGGIKVAKTDQFINCDSQFEDQGYILTRTTSYDSRHIIFPSLIEEDSNLQLYYTGLGTNSIWRLNLASSSIVPTNTPTVTPGVTVSPTPTQSNQKKSLIIIPGFMASWNKDALLFNKTVSQSEWEMLSFVKEYEGLIKTLENLGYIKDQDFFVFNYDWRKPVIEITEDLNNYVTNNSSLSSNFKIIGHSLGGLIGRVYKNKYNNNNLEELITVGSPHRGVAQVYKVVEAGEIDRSDSYFWLAVKLVINLNRNKPETDRQIINRLFPVLKDLLPIYNFLIKDENVIDINSMVIKNELLLNESPETDLISISGEKGPTLKGFIVKEQTLVDKLLDNYPDGRPISSFNNIGDYLVLAESAKLNNPITMNLDHGELVYKKEAIKKILDILNIQYNEESIVEGKGTKLDQALLIFIKSKGKMEIKYKNKKYFDQNGIIIIENIEPGQYQLKVKGVKSEEDDILLFKIKKDKEDIEKIGKINNINQINTYNINY